MIGALLLAALAAGQISIPSVEITPTPSIEATYGEARWPMDQLVGRWVRLGRAATSQRFEAEFIRADVRVEESRSGGDRDKGGNRVGHG